MRWIVLVLVLVLGLGALGISELLAQNRDLVLAPSVQQGRRLALVIGNDTYPATPLKNARNDARAMAQALTELGFGVTTLEDVTRARLVSGVAAFAGTLQSLDLALFFFAGHGKAVDNENFLLPTDVAGGSIEDVRLGGVAASEVERALRKARVRVLVLDACRTNAFGGTRAGDGGLAPMQARGTLVAFATRANETASDNAAGANGLFTTELVRVLREPDLALRDIFYRVRQRVDAASGGRQFPALYDELATDVVLRTSTGNLPAESPTPPVRATERVPTEARLSSSISDALSQIPRISNTRWRTPALANGAILLAKSGDVATSRDLLRDALAAVDAFTPDVFRTYAISRIARAQVETGDLDGALRTTSQIPPKISHRAWSLIEIASALAYQRKFEDANRVLLLAVSAIEALDGNDDLSRQSRLNTLVRLAEAQREFGSVQDAAQSLRRAESELGQIPVNSSNWAQAVTAIARANFKSGNTGEARGLLATAAKVIESDTVNTEVTLALSEIAMAFWQIGQFTEAGRVTDIAFGYFARLPAQDRDYVVRDVARAQTTVGRRDAAIRTASMASEQGSRAYAIEGIIQQLIANDRLADAAPLLKSIEQLGGDTDIWLSGASGLLAEAYAKNGEFLRVAEVARFTSREFDRAGVGLIMSWARERFSEKGHSAADLWPGESRPMVRAHYALGTALGMLSRGSGDTRRDLPTWFWFRIEN
jgi:uncharacterized caspase-like protein